MNTAGAIVALVAFTLGASACGSSDGNHQESPVTVGTLAYVVSECHVDDQGGSMRQSLQIRQGDQAPIIVVEHTSAIFRSSCDRAGQYRDGAELNEFGVFHRLGVTPDTSLVVFEVTDDYLPAQTLPPEQKGIFVVSADGTGLRRLAPASREPPKRFATIFQKQSGRWSDLRTRRFIAPRSTAARIKQTHDAP